VIHIQGYRHPKGKRDEKKGDVIMTAVVQKLSDGWKILAFQNTPVQPGGPPPSK
jgi:very-short-patch-repair endonuclease